MHGASAVISAMGRTEGDTILAGMAAFVACAQRGLQALMSGEESALLLRPTPREAQEMIVGCRTYLIEYVGVTAPHLLPQPGPPPGDVSAPRVALASAP